MLLEDRVAIVTGANRGIGRAIVELFLDNGAEVCAVVRNRGNMENVAAEIQEKNPAARLAIYEADFSDETSIKDCIKAIRADKKSIDILVCNAGIIPKTALFAMSADDELTRVFQVNFFGAMQLAKSVIKVMMRKKRGSIINISSIAALDGEPGQVEYSSSKAALIGATKKLAAELGQLGIRVNAVAPGVTKTDMIKDMEDSLLSKMVENTALRRLAEPEEIAKAVLFLASDMSSYITGQVIRVDGGLRR